MTRRFADVRGREAERGSALAIALVFMMLFAIWIGSVLQFATADQRTGISVAEEAVSTYAGGGAIDAAINEIRDSLGTGTEAAGTSTCFTLPAGALDNSSALTVTCVPRSGSGAASGGSSTSLPDQAVLTLPTDATEGMTVAATSSLPVQGDILSAGTLNVPITATLTGTGAIKAGTCVTTGTVSPACQSGATASDPAWSGPSTASTPLVGTLPACAGQITLNPGVYRSASALQAVLNCPSAVVWFRPGTYFFDFRDAGSHALTVPAGTDVVGGAPSGWTPGSTAPPYPTVTAPTTSACDQNQAGVDFVFGGDSRLNAAGGRVQLCALNTTSSDQHIVLRGLRSAASVTTTSAPTATTSASSNPAGAWAWDNPAQGAQIDGTVAHVKIPNTRRGPSKLTLSGLGASIVPTDATGVSVTVTAVETLDGTGNTSLQLVAGSGASPAPVLLRDCPSGAPCVASAFDPTRSDTVTITGLTPGQVNGMSLVYVVSNPDNSPIEAWLDGVTVSVSYTLPVAAVSGTAVASPYVPGSAGTTPLLSASGAGTVLALHGTVYAPRSAIDLSLAAVPYTVIDRGLVARHLRSAMTRDAAYSGPLISVPGTGTAKRRVLLVVTDAAGAQLGRADVTFANAADNGNGTIPRVNEWSIG